MASDFRMLIHSAEQVVLIVSNGEKVLKGAQMKNIAVLNQVVEGISIVIDSNGKIAAINWDSEIQKQFNSITFKKTINATGLCVLPGLIDSHTHPVWAGDRVHEFAMKLAGATYMEVHAAGGGIHFTVDHTRQASEEELYSLLKSRLMRMLTSGTTLVECKSGYGLNAETEIKMLKVLEKAKQELPIEISSTFCGAHAVPKDSTAEMATIDVINVQLPQIKELMDAGELTVDNIDVFCEMGVFDVDQSRRILNAGLSLGLAINFHGDELYPTKSAEMGAELKARAISHLEEISEAGISAMAAADCAAIILPTTAYILRLKPPPVRQMINAGVPICLGTDFNPNAFCLSMPLIMHLACVNLQMSMEEALVAATINSAAALGKNATHGSLEVGKVGDLIILNAPRWEHLIYQMGGHDNVIKYVIKGGIVVHQNQKSV